MNGSARILLLVAQTAWAAAFCYVLTLPLFTARTPIPFLRKDTSVLSTVADLAPVDPFLSVVVALCGIVFPLAKAAASIWVLVAGRMSPRLARVLHFLARFSMADVFLAALAIVIFKGLSYATLEILPGFQAFAGLVVAGLVLSLMVERVSR